MTRLSYKVGNYETVSYAEATKLAKETGAAVEKVYTPIDENAKVDPEKRAKTIAAILAHRAH